MSSISIRRQPISTQLAYGASLAKRNVDHRPVPMHDLPMQHSEGFLAIVKEARTGVSEIDLNQAGERLANNPDTILMDVREDSEWSNGHAAEAVHLGKGILERDIESVVPDKDTEVIMYCGGGYRSVLTAEVAKRMGYSRVHSLIGGYKALEAAGWQMENLE